MPKESLLIWICQGYSLFAAKGPAGLKVEVISKQVGKSKSSFYHHFADLEIFTTELLEYHYSKALEIAERMKGCSSMDPELFDVLIDVEEDILFMKQLRVHRHNTEFNEYIQKCHAPIEQAMLATWSGSLGLLKKSSVALMLLSLAVDNFYLRVTPGVLTHKWLRDYLGEYRFMVKALNDKA